MTQNIENSPHPFSPKTWTMSQSTLDALQTLAKQAKQQEEYVRRMAEGPLQDVAKAFEFLESHRTDLEKAFKSMQLPKIDLEMFSFPMRHSSIMSRPVIMAPAPNPEPEKIVEDENVETNKTNQVTEKEVLLVLCEIKDGQNRMCEMFQTILNRSNKEKKKRTNRIILFDQDFNLSVQGHPRSKYNLSQSPLRRRILMVLKPEFTTTTELAQTAEAGSIDSLMKTIGDMNRKIKSNLKLKAPLIEGAQGSGYRITPEYQFLDRSNKE